MQAAGDDVRRLNASAAVSRRTGLAVEQAEMVESVDLVVKAVEQGTMKAHLSRRRRRRRATVRAPRPASGPGGTG